MHPRTMSDQAYDLRQLAMRFRPAPPSRVRRAAVLAVVGGTANVGATTVAMGLVAALAESGRQSLFVAADSCGAQTAMADQLLDAVDRRLIEAELVVFDAGYTINEAVGRICRRADRVLIVTTPEPSDVLNAFATIESLTAGAARGASGGVEDRKVPALPTAKHDSRFHLLINMSPSAAAADSAHARLAWAARRLLGVRLRSAGYIQREKAALPEGISRFCLNLRALSVDTIRELLVSDCLLNWRRRGKFNGNPIEAFAEQLEMDF